ncbi:ABC transporter ATP-binding protein [Isoptericola croceus]|uniref:ABC transporter ATP-binding protein n=1 Tax=Isoptericola croceus TaxID=3031406 RepID=UPI0023F650EE|nr:ABC transporter ATP-binding protein [Isoptericola croceus]
MKQVLAPVRGRLLTATLLQAVGSVVGTIALILLAELGARAAGAAVTGSPVDRAEAVAQVGWAGAALLVAAVLVGAATTVSHLADSDLQLTLRERLVDRLSRVRLGWFTGTDAGRVKKAVQDDTGAMHHLVAHALLDAVGAVAVPMTVLVYLLATQPLLGLPMLALAAAAVWTFQTTMRGSGPRMAEYGQRMAELNGAAVETVECIDVVRLYARRGGQARRFEEAGAAFHGFFRGWVGQTSVRTAVAFVLALPLTAVLVVVATAAGLVAAGWVEAAAVVPALVLAPLCTAPISTVGTRFPALRGGLAAAASVQQVLELPVMPTPGEQVAQPDGHEVRLEDVTFGYDAERPVLHGVSFACEPGTVTAVVGASGAGKSTLASLLARFEDVDSGRITLGGVDLRDLTSEQLYARVGFVFQDVVLLRGSVHDAVACGRPGAGRDDVVAAARAAGIHDRIVAEQRGYDAEIGRDVEFSQGEAQRISIARALLADTPVLVLDEATAYADAESEAHVQRALSRLARGRTVVVVAHRLATVRHVDQIVVLDDGRLVQRGTHDELLSDGAGRYAALWRAHDGAENAEAEPMEARS